MKRFISFFLALTLVLGTMSPAAGSVRAAETEEPQITAITVACENGTVMDKTGENEILSGTTAEVGTEFRFTVVPVDGYKVLSVTSNDETVTADSDGIYTVTVAEAMTVAAVCAPKEAPVFTVAALPEGVSQEKLFAFTIISNDDPITTKAYSRDTQYTSVGDLGAAILTGNAHQIDDSTVITENGTYYVYLIDASGKMSFQTVEITDIDRTAPMAAVAVRTDEGWCQDTSYTVTIPAPEDVTRITLTVPGSIEEDFLPDAEGAYTFHAPVKGTYEIRVYDLAGNCTVTAVQEEQVDNTPPVVSFTRTPEGWTTSATYTYTASDVGSEVELLYVTIGSSSFTIFFDPEDTYIMTLAHGQTASIRAVDLAGNEYTLDITESQTDTTAPVISVPERSGSDWLQEAVYTFQVTEAGSGIQSVTLTVGEAEMITLTPDENGVYTFSLAENNIFTIEATDNVGLNATYTAEESRIDVAAPEISGLRRVAEGWQKEAAYEFAASDAVQIVSVTVACGEQEISVTEVNGLYTFIAAENGTYTITVTDIAGNITTAEIQEAETDSEVPVISYTRSQEGWTDTASYTFTAEDLQSGVQYLYVTIGGNTTSIVFDTEDTYIFTLSENQTIQIRAVDFAGNEAFMDLTEDQIDSAPPVIEAPIRSVDGWAVAAEYTFTVSDDGSGVREVLLIANGESSVLTPSDGGIYSFTLEKNTTFQIQATDNLGQESTFDGEETQIDTAAPKLPVFTRVPEGWAQSAEYTFTPSDDLSGIAQVTVSFGDQEIPVAITDGSYSFTTEQNGTYTVIIRDTTGNETTARVIEEQIDLDTPEVSFTRSESGWTTSAAYTITAEDASSGVAYLYVTIDGNTTTIVFDSEDTYTFTLTKNQSVQIRAVDFAGNEVSAEVTEEQIDTTAPVISTPVRSVEGWATSAYYTFTVTDPDSGIRSVSISLDGGSFTALTPDENGVYTFTLTENTAFQIQAIDNLGLTTTLDGKESQIDTVVPVTPEIIRTPSGWAQEASYTFIPEDELSGIRSVLLSYNGTEEELASENGVYQFSVSENGAYTIRISDVVGNEVTVTVTEAMLDQTAPAVSAVREQEGWQLSATYTIQASDDSSGIRYLYITVDGEEKTYEFDSEKIYQITMDDNENALVRAVDYAGNEYTLEIQEDRIDKTVPQISVPERSINEWSITATYSFTVTDTQSGVAAVIVAIDGQEPLVLTADEHGYYSFTVDDNVSFEITAKDNLGHTASVTGTESLIDVISPEITDVNRVTDGWAQSADYKFRAEDMQSGITSVSVSYNGEQISVTEQGSLYTFTADTNGTYTITVIDKTGNVSSVDVTEEKVDTTVPVIGQPVRSESGWLYEAEYIFTTEDPASGIAAVFVFVNDVELELLPGEDGKYRFTVAFNQDVTIRVADIAGNEDSITFTESYVDPNTPTISDLTRITETWNTFADYTFRVSDDLSGVAAVTVLFGSGEERILTPDASGVCRFTMTANDTFQIVLTDITGNVSTLDGEETQVDTTDPVIESIDRASDTWEYDVLYTITVSDNLAGIASVTYYAEGQPATATVLAGDGKYTFLADRNTVYTVTVTDLAGNTTTQTVQETLLDQTAPTIYDVHRDTPIWSQYAYHFFRAEDTASGIASVTVSDGEKTINYVKQEDGSYRFLVNINGTYTVTVTDNVGNTTRIVIRESLIDLTAPVISQIIPQSEWDASTNTVIIYAQDESELASVSVTDADGNAYTVTQQADGSFQFIADRNGTYTILAVDTAGNSTTAQANVWHIDTQKPSAPVLESTGKEEWVNVDVTVTASSTDSQSGVVAYWYYPGDIPFDPALWQKATFADGTGSVVFQAEQDTLYSFVAEDLVGRISDSTSIRVAIDKTAPADCTLTFLEDENSGYLRTVDGKKIYNDKVTFLLTASDEASGIMAYEYQTSLPNYIYPWEKVDGNEEGIVRVLRLADTYASVYFKVYDQAGNCTEICTSMVDGKPEVIILENTPETDETRAEAPSLEATAHNTPYTGIWTNQDVEIQVFGSQAISGIEYYEWRMLPHGEMAVTDWERVPENADGISSLVFDTNLNCTIVFRSVTYAGNYSQESYQTVRIQKSTPVAATITPEVPTGTNGWYTVLPGYDYTLPAWDSMYADIRYDFYYSFNGEEFICTDDKAPKIDKDGIWQIYITATDDAGNRTDSEIITFKVDTKVPDTLDVLLNGSLSILQTSSGDTEYDRVNILDQTSATDFSLFYREPVTITVNADGGDSKLAGIFYQTVTDNTGFQIDGTWIPLPAGGLTLTPDSKHCLYFKAVDTAGNITYFSGTSIIMDASVPGGKDPAAAITMIPTEENLSRHGYYYGDVTVSVHVEEPVLNTVFAGLESIRYRVLADGNVTQTGTLPLDAEHVTMQESRILAWDGVITIDAEKNNSNNVVLELTATDKAGNIRVSTMTAIRIDITDPVIRAEYVHNTPAEIRGGVTYFTGKRTLIFTVTERNFVAGESFVRVTDNDSGKNVAYTWNSEGDIHTAVLDITADGHYTVSASITDSAGNTYTTILYADGTVAGDAFVIDNTAPVVTVTYDNNDGNDIYFKEHRTATITVVERNFDPRDIDLDLGFLAAGDENWAPALGAWTSDGNTHTAHIQMNHDGIYTLGVTCNDIPGNEAADTRYLGSASQRWILDTKISAPQVEDVKDSAAYAGDVVPSIYFLDPYLETISIKLYRTRMLEIRKDVTDLLLAGTAAVNVEGGKMWTLDIFPEEESFDGIYTLEATMSDKAGNTSRISITFSVNRFGSTYIYGEELVEINGKVIYELDDVLTITEINPTRIQQGSAVIRITRDGTPIPNPIYTIDSPLNGREPAASHGWYEYLYKISPENFTQDGIYTIVLSTKDAAGNVPENTSGDQIIRFAIDTTAPELTSVIGLEESIVKADSLDVTFFAIDNIGLERIDLYVDGELAAQWRELDSYQFSAAYTVTEGLERHLRLVITDKAGNVLDTDSETFNPGFAWQDVTVSSNALLRYYANKPLFYGSIGGVSGGGLLLFFLLKNKKKKEEKEGNK